MGRTILFSGFLCAAMLLAAHPSWGEGDGAGNGHNLHGHHHLSTDEVTPSGTPIQVPFKPYDPGPASALWQYSDLKAAGKAQVDRNRDTSAWDPVHQAYAVAVVARAQAAAAQTAALQLGLGELPLGQEGVVP